MPPTRSMPPAKAVKTERTHEENQERAYIAASRRSDRSLEARVESARRASEIHKRRTGRSLRVTEQDVQNEEMYEEEDDDLPLQYRRLTAHLQTGSADFNRRLSAYLTNHVAMRSALEQSIHNSYAQQFPNAPQYQNQNMFPSPMLAHQQQQQQMMQPPHSPSMHRQQPYPSPQQQGFSLSHQRANSIAVPGQSTSTLGPNSPDYRRSMSMSAEGSSSTPSQTSTASSETTPSTTSQHHKPSFPPGSFSQPMQHNNNNNNNLHQQPQQQFTLPTYDMGAFGHSQFPTFTTQLPAETQGFLGSTMDQSDPLTSMMMAGGVAGNFWDFTSGGVLAKSGMGGVAHEKSQQQQQYAPSLAGLNATLAPAELSNYNTNDSKSISTATKTDDAGVEVEEAGSNQNEELFFENAMMGKDGTTPGLNGDSWDSWINDGSWDATPTASQ